MSGKALNPRDCVHIAIDMQDHFMFNMAEMAEPLTDNILRFAADLKKFDIPTIWVGWPQYNLPKVDAHKISTVGAVNSVMTRHHRFRAGMPDGDLATLKKDCDAFTNKQLAPYLAHRLKRHTIIGTGLYLKDCYEGTMWGSLRQPQGFSFVAPANLVGSDIQYTNSGDGKLMRSTDLAVGDYAAMARDNHAYLAKLRADNPGTAPVLLVTDSDDVLARLNIGMAAANEPVAARRPQTVARQALPHHKAA